MSQPSRAPLALGIGGVLSLLGGVAALSKAFVVAGRLMYGQMLSGYGGTSPLHVQLAVFLAIGSTLYLGGAILLAAAGRARP